jgi:hypothetical protein
MITIIYTFTIQMGPTSGPNGNGPYVRIQVEWVMRQNSSEMSLTTRLNSLGSGVRT